MLFFAGAMGLAARIAEKFPDMKLIVDHLGGLHGDAEEAQKTLDRLLYLEKFPKVAVKVSTLPFRSKVGYPFPEVHGIIKQVFETFGPKRCFWGSDHTQIMARNLATYPEQVDLIRKAVDFLSDSDREWLLGRAASEYLGWPEGVPSTAVAHPRS
jgi:predicted TIM-barrel fold metal-dependent hydrolase